MQEPISQPRVVRQLFQKSLIEYESHDKEKLSVAAYARVSTLADEQEFSFERQVEHFTKYIESNAEWKLYHIYADQGITGTRAEKRPEFMQMIKDCEEGLVKKVLVKSITRFARNTVDALTTIQKLKELGVSICFENENIDTLSPGGEILITILAANAEQESRNMSTNIKWAFQKKFKNGEVMMANIYGYYKAEDGSYEINELEAMVVKRIYREFLCGYSTCQICRGLERDGILSLSGRDKWAETTIMSMLKNEKYSGSAVLGKTYKRDVLSPTRRKNNGEAPQYYVEKSHPAIITKEMFDLTQAEIASRKNVRSYTNSGNGKFSSAYAFSGILVCSECGSKYRRLIRKRENREEVTWLCFNRQVNKSKCSAITIREVDVENAYLKALGKIVDDAVINTLKTNMDEALFKEDEMQLASCLNEIEKQQSQAIELLKEKREHRISEAEYKEKIGEISVKLKVLEAQQQELQERNNEVMIKLHQKVEIAELVTAENLLDKFEPDVFKSLVKQITVINKNEVEIEFKCGVQIIENLK